ncbi:ATP-binding cassette domain-containing protein [Leptospira sp. 2 VSF19]|uniref:ATP-binding cassette domain-containing protein n=1 Tax=Leptospira soteropolitanensis TaxID=2950025 RepID=A0AAW5VMY5_9LEPT|nr:ATP-binding cassette domain-containing protein [Leptospira soteropolitanensis]MCW7492260.1 ATP-binding cassette domain-containing protein [Leptospira soteropolitanensis]MCW7499842.1 ATP-binding cassette domain-containing protein [Leptospira soteropolitanensis]MCW7522093.1 ATP-binding cassette domain-containing protein [Leptospira soteropolitanensis]MCW7525947.1 ATP-binding cassette domain-containing protein [Leptospira soteropolitanensis]MCW7529939.1 ATP-binding cassette domain-containing p
MGSIDPNVIQIKNATIGTKDGQKIWKGISLQIQRGIVHGIIGESGSGKSTLGFSLFGMVPKGCTLSYEKFLVLGEDVLSKRLGTKLFMVPQNPNSAFHPFRTIRAQIQDFFKLSGLKNISYDSLFLIWDELSIPRTHWKTYARTLSGGEKQRILLSLAFLRTPEILVLDEPTTGLDAFSEKIVLETVQNLAKMGMTIVFITHELRIVESLASQVTIMKQGEVLETISVLNQNLEPKTEYGKQLKEASLLFQ